MSLKVIGVGVGRTGTYSLKLALNQLGFGPTHHMEEIIIHMPKQLPLWQAAANGRPDWPAIFEGYPCAVDWPTAGFYQELYLANPSAQFILTHRDPDSWAESFSSTIYKLISGPGQVPEPMRPWIEMATAVIAKTGFPLGLDNAALATAFNKHTAAVKAVIPPSQLLLFQVKEGWEPLCAHLGAAVPNEPFPRTNDRDEFWQKVAPAAKVQ